MGRPVPRGDSSGRMSRVKLPGVQLWSAYLVVGALALVVHANLETGSLEQSWFYDVVGASAVLAAIVGIIRNAPDRRLPWMFMAAGQALFVAGDVLWNWYTMIGEEPFPSLADVLYLAGYPFMAAGIFLLIRRRIGGGDRGGLFLLAAGHQQGGAGDGTQGQQLDQFAFANVGHVCSGSFSVGTGYGGYNFAILARTRQEPGKNGLPSDAGMLTRIHAALREISTSTTIADT